MATDAELVELARRHPAFRRKLRNPNALFDGTAPRPEHPTEKEHPKIKERKATDRELVDRFPALKTRPAAQRDAHDAAVKAQQDWDREHPR